MPYKEFAPPGGARDGAVAISDKEFDRDRAGVIERLREAGDLETLFKRPLSLERRP